MNWWAWGILICVLISSGSLANDGIRWREPGPGSYAVVKDHTKARDKQGDLLPLLLPEHQPVAVILEITSPELELSIGRKPTQEVAASVANRGRVNFELLQTERFGAGNIPPLQELAKPLRHKLLSFDFSSSVQQAMMADLPSEFTNRSMPVTVVETWPDLHRAVQEHAGKVVLLAGAHYFIDAKFRAIGVMLSIDLCQIDKDGACRRSMRPAGPKVRGVWPFDYNFRGQYERQLAASMKLKAKMPVDHARCWNSVTTEQIASWVREGISALTTEWSGSIRKSYRIGTEDAGIWRPSAFEQGYHWLIRRDGERVLTMTSRPGLQIIDYGDFK
ncbi:hypothetical protein [Ahniella affigens]|nr:hypothetical protein [Ahniella affigens]